MNIKDYLKDRSVFLLTNVMLFTIMWGILLLFDISPTIIILIFCFWFLPIISYIMVEFMKQKNFYNEVFNIMDELDKKYLLSEIIKVPEFIEGKLL